MYLKKYSSHCVESHVIWFILLEKYKRGQSLVYKKCFLKRLNLKIIFMFKTSQGQHQKNRIKGKKQIISLFRYVTVRVLDLQYIFKPRQYNLCTLKKLDTLHQLCSSWHLLLPVNVRNLFVDFYFFLIEGQRCFYLEKKTYLSPSMLITYCDILEDVMHRRNHPINYDARHLIKHFTFNLPLLVSIQKIFSLYCLQYKNRLT